MKKQAFSLIELSIVVLIIGVVTIVALNGKSLVVKANCVASTLGSKAITDNLNNPTALTKNKSTAYENCVSTGGVVTINTCSGSACTSCKALLEENPGIASGTYTIDPDGAGGLASFSAYCDMTTDSGGWTLVLNYLHSGATNPALYSRTTNLPVIGSTTLATDESLPTPTTSTYWGHADPTLLNKFTFTDLRFYGKTSGHSRIIHFKTSLAGCITYFKTGTGSCTGLNPSFTSLTGHTAYVPSQVDSYYTNHGNQAMTNFSFYRGGAYHWGIKGNGGRWEVDDGCGSGCNTYHQIWIR